MLAERPSRILVIEDEPDLAELIAGELEVEGYQVEVALDGMRGLLAARRQPPDLVVLDRMLGDLDGLDVCRRLRTTSQVPILMLTALGQVRQRVEGLDAGATDYLPKPFALDELVARVRAQLRLKRPAPVTRFEVADLTLDHGTREVRRGERGIALTPKEYDLLAYLIMHPRQVKTRAQILEAVWSYDFGGEDNVLEVTVSHLRAKLEGAGEPRLLHTVRGVGYVLRDNG